MEYKAYKFLQNNLINWLIPLTMGVAFLILSIVLFIEPLKSFGSLSWIFSICIFVAGIFEIIYGATGNRNMNGRIWYLLGGIISLTIGFVLILNPKITALFLPYYFGFWMLFRSILILGYHNDLKQNNLVGAKRFMGLGLLTLLLSIIILLNPILAQISFMYLTSITFLALALFNFGLAFSIKKIKDTYLK